MSTNERAASRGAGAAVSRPPRAATSVSSVDVVGAAAPAKPAAAQVTPVPAPAARPRPCRHIASADRHDRVAGQHDPLTAARRRSRRRHQRGRRQPAVDAGFGAGAERRLPASVQRAAVVRHLASPRGRLQPQPGPVAGAASSAGSGGTARPATLPRREGASSGGVSPVLHSSDLRRAAPYRVARTVRCAVRAVADRSDPRASSATSGPAGPRGALRLDGPGGGGSGGPESPPPDSGASVPARQGPVRR